MIVKIQVSLIQPSRTLIYNETGSIQFEEPTTPDVLELMKGRPKAFFHATVEDTILVIGDEVQTQTQEW